MSLNSSSCHCRDERLFRIGIRKDDQKLVLLMDGQLALWEAAKMCLGETARIEILDIIHVSAYVWEAAALLTNTEAERLAFTREQLMKILQGQVAEVIRGLHCCDPKPQNKNFLVLKVRRLVMTLLSR